MQKLKSRVEASIEFSFKGETHKISARIDLDAMMEKQGTLPDIHRLLAAESRIDTYSYMYEVMEMQEVTFADAEGLAVECLVGDQFDFEKFESLWKENSVAMVLGPIAKKHFDVDDLEQRPEIKAALVEAFNAGKST
ncbi:MAG: hypothetical protein ABW072_06935 [Sedimenticola sp.]